MSRKIADKTAVTITSEEAALRDTSEGKILFTDYHNKKCAALIKNDRLTAVSFPEASASKIGAVYIGKVKNVVSNINACFVEISDKEVCFLPLKDAAFPLLLNRKFDGRILAGDELPVQVVRDAQKTKQASVTARISLSNKYFVLELGSAAVNYSSKLTQAQRLTIADQLTEEGILEGNRLAQSMFLPSTISLENAHTASLPPASSENTFAAEDLRLSSENVPNSKAGAVPVGMPPVGMIVRTQAGEYSGTLSESFRTLAGEFSTLLRNALHYSCFSCLKSPDPFEQMLDQLASPNEFDELVTDEEVLYDKLIAYVREHMPQKKVRLYTDTTLSLKSLYSLATKLETALNERVWLKSGGYLIIQPTEALTVIDVNSGKYEAKRGSEETALKMNLEAAEEIALQLRLRNLSGIIIVDFINMKEEKSRQELLHFLKIAVRKDRLQTTVVDMTPLGLVELTRKKENKPLYEQIRVLKAYNNNL